MMLPPHPDRLPAAPGGPGAKRSAPTSGSAAIAGKKCRGCGYDLSGLTTSGLCPECGFAIWRSMEGALLASAWREYVDALHAGLRLVLAMILCQIALMVIGFLGFILIAASGEDPDLHVFGVVINVLDTIASVLITWGYWRFTQPDEALRGAEPTASSRRIIRVTAVTRAVCDLLLVLINTFQAIGEAQASASGGGVSSGSAGDIFLLLITLVSIGAWAVQFFAVMRYVRWLADRVPDPELAKTTRTYLWALPLLTIVGAIFLVGPLVALVLYWQLLNKLRGRVAEAMEFAISRPVEYT